MSHYRYVVSATSAIGVRLSEEALGGISTRKVVDEFERLGSTNIAVARKHDGAAISMEEIGAIEAQQYADWVEKKDW